MHQRNRYQGHYDLAALFALEPLLATWACRTPAGELTLNFAEPEAVKLLNKALLKHWYNLNWELDSTNLCPPIPGRADYIHYLADLLSQDLQQNLGSKVKILDIGTGANCIYPLIGHAEYGWRFTGSDIQSASLKSAQHILALNPHLSSAIRLRRQKQAGAIFHGIIHPDEFYHATMCNPPFHTSAEAAAAGTERKNRNLGIEHPERLNFAGKFHELWCEGGEASFIEKMIEESIDYHQQVLWFTTLVSKQQNLFELKKKLKRLSVPVVKEVAMQQGNKKSRFLAWSFSNKMARRERVKPA